MSFRSRLTALVGAAVALSIAAAAAILFVVVSTQLYAQLDAQLAGRARQIAAVAEDIAQRCPGSIGVPGSTVTASPSSSPLPAPSPSSGTGASGGPVCPPAGGVNLPAPRPGDSAGVVQFISTSGAVIRPGDQTTEIPVTPSALALAVNGSGDDVVENVEVGGVPMRLLSHAIASGALQVALPRDAIEQVLSNLRWLLLVTSLVGVVIAVVLGRVIANSALGPVARLTRATERVAGTRDLSERVEEPGKDELGRLAHSFNRMLEALDASEQSRRQLVADASHELRTPMTSLRTNIEVLALGTDLAPDDRAQLLASLTGETERLSQLVADLMELARGDEVVESATVDVQLDAIVEEAVAAVRAHYPAVVFVVHARPSVVIGDPARLRRAVDNLLDNAGKWSPDGASVDVEVGSMPGAVSVRDHGPGIDPADREHVFDRFWRAPSARGTPGSGLGLAIVAQTAEALGGEVRLESPPDGGSRFVLRLQPASRGA